MDQGWIKLHRQVLDNHFLMNDTNAFIVFIKLLLMVNRNGEWAGGRRQLAKFYDLNDRTLYGILLRMQKAGIISLSTNPKYTIIIIKNWKSFQGVKTLSEKNDNHTLHKFDKKVPFWQPDSQPLTQPPINRLELGDSQPLTQPDSQQRRNSDATTRQHYNKNKKENKNSTNVLVELPTASPRTITSKEFFGQIIEALGFSDRVTLTPGRLQKLKARLKTFKASEILVAARNVGADGFLQGDNPSGKRYGDIDYLLRKDETIDKYLNLTYGKTLTAIGGPIDESRYI